MHMAQPGRQLRAHTPGVPRQDFDLVVQSFVKQVIDNAARHPALSLPQSGCARATALTPTRKREASASPTVQGQTETDLLSGDKLHL